MIYRMKQNAAGLATICILSTMVLVTVSTTVSLYGGINEILNSRYPSQLCISKQIETEQDEADAASIAAIVSDAVQSSGLGIEAQRQYTSLEFAMLRDNNSFRVARSSGLTKRQSAKRFCPLRRSACAMPAAHSGSSVRPM